MKICHLSTVHLHNDIRVFQKECVSLAEAGHDVSFIVPCNESFIEKGVQIVAIKRRMSKFARLCIQPIVVLKEAFLVDADVYHFHDFELWPVALVLRMFGKKVVADIHEDVPGQLLQRDWIPVQLKQPVSRLAAFLENVSSKFMSAIVVADEVLQTRFVRHNADVISLHNYPILSELPSPEPREKFTVTSVGGVFDERCANILISAADRLPDVDIQIAGGISKVYADCSWTTDNCTYLGRVTLEEVKKLYVESDILVVMFSDAPNHQEIKSNRLFESMYAGKPVLVSSLAHWKAFIEKHQCGLPVLIGSVDDFVQKVNALKNDAGLRLEYGEKGRRAVYESFSWDVEKKKLCLLYERLT